MIKIKSTYHPPERLDYNEQSKHIKKLLDEMYKTKHNVNTTDNDDRLVVHGFGLRGWRVVRKSTVPEGL